MKMKHKTIIFALLGVLIAIFILVRYGLFIVYWLTTPNTLEQTKAEKQLIEHFKAVFKTNEITITPKYDIKKILSIQYIYRISLVQILYILKKKLST